ncbi:MAG: hypothetical protein KDD63_08635, partial [Bacteroidetes bacterium]|nr:hypothetical protein [Bacteroidota bacterium]
MKRTLLSTLLFIGFSSLFAQPPGSGSALTFDGINDYVNISNTAALNPTSAITVEAWIKADTWGINPWSNSIINKEGWALGPQGYTLRCGQNGRLSFNFGNAGVWHEVVSTPQMSTNRWYHVVGTYNGSVMQIYINGQLVGTTNYSGSIAVGTYDVRIGEIAYTAAGSRLFDGQIDEVRIWNQALSNTTIRNWMCKKVDNTHPNYANLAGYWRMDDGAGTTLSGSAGTPLNGTLVNGPTWATSSAPIGDESVYKYGAMIPLGLAHPDGDSLSIDTITGSPSAIHIYRVDEEPNVTAPPSGFNLVDSTRYWGVFAVGGTNPSFDVTYHYSGNPMVTAACGLGMARRSNNASINWADAGAIELPAMSQLYVNNTTPGEFILSTQALTVNVTALGALAFCQGDSVTLNGSIGPSATYQWRLNGADIIGATDSVITVNVSGAYS